MVSVTKHKRGGYYMEVRPLPGVRKQVYLGKITKTLAERFKANIERLQQSQALNIEDHEITLWAAGLDPELRVKLLNVGIRLPEAAKTWIVGNWIQHITDNYPGKDRTRKNLETARKHWHSYLGMKKLSEVTVGDARQCVERILSTSKRSHGVKLCERGRMFFERAVEHKLIDVNPFAGLKFGDKRHDKSRQSYIPKATIEKIIQEATSSEARALIALARFCGLRVPSEPLAITWADIDWENRRIRVPYATKTGQRTLPMFEAEGYLRSLYDHSQEGSSYVFTRARSSAATTWREWLEAAISAAQIPQWEKLWVNLRASCRTDLEDEYPGHVCDAWLGHSSRVAKDHYAMVSPDHWEKASRTGRDTSAQVSAQGKSVSEVVGGGETKQETQEASE
jgi:integrase